MTQGKCGKEQEEAQRRKEEEGKGYLHDGEA